MADLSDTLNLSIPIPASDQAAVTPADDAYLSGRTKSPKDGLNPALIPDGFSYNVHLKFLPYRAFPMQLRLMEQYRRESLQGLWQPRWYTVPQDPSVPIAIGDTLSYQIRMARGTVIWGASFDVIAPALTTDLRITMVDECTNHVLTTEFEVASSFTPNFPTGTPSSGFNAVLMFEPYPMSGDMPMLMVNIVNTDPANPKKCQLLLLCQEPAGTPG